MTGEHSSGEPARYPACAFLFDGSAEGLPDDPLFYFTEQLLAALSAADPDGRTRSRLLTGLPTLHSLADRVTGVSAHAKGGGRRQSNDLDTYKYLVFEWLDSLNSVWNTIDAEKGVEVFRLLTGECVTLVTLDPAVRTITDRSLRALPGYVGAFEIDPGNPIHRVGFVEQMLYRAAIIDGTVVQDRSYEGDEDDPVDGAARFRPGGLRWEPMGWLAMNGPPGFGALVLSDRGAQATERYLRKHKASVAGLVLQAIEQAYWLNPDRKTFEFALVDETDDILEVLMPDTKFTGYLFNRDHAVGGSKAVFFIDVLGIEPDDWRYLAAQFYFGLLQAEPDKLEFREWGESYGMRFNVEISVCGRSGKSVVVRTGWMMEPGKLPSLSSAMPGHRNAEAVNPGKPPILPPGNRGDAEWAQLWAWANAAGVKAAEQAVPTPMYIVDEAPISEGMYGLASIRVRDARRGFARWLSKQWDGEVDGRGGVVVFSPIASQSIDRATAWAREVMLVLKLNGVDAELETFLD